MNESAGRPLEILLLYDCVYPEAHGGVEHRNREMALALARRGHRVTIAGWASAASSPAPGVQVRPVPYRTELYNAEGKRRLMAALRWTLAVARVDLKGFDLVETANLPYIHLFPLTLRCRLRRVPLVVTWYEGWGRYWRQYVGRWKWPIFAAIEWLAAQLSREVNAMSALTADRLRRIRWRRGEIPVLPSGIPVDSIRGAASETQKAGPPLVYAGRLHVEKRVDLLLEAVARLENPVDGKLLKVIGGGPDRERLEILSPELGIETKVEFLGHLPDSAAVWRELGCAEVAVQPSSREGFGLFPLESMAAGLPVVYCASPESAVPELVRDGREGLESAPDAADLARVLERLLDDSEERRRLATNARARAEQYDWDRIGEQVETLSYRWAGAAGASAR